VHGTLSGWDISPNEEWLLVCLQGSGLFAIATDGSSAQDALFLKESSCLSRGTFFSRDGKEVIAVLQDDDQKYDLWHMRLDPPDPTSPVQIGTAEAPLGAVHQAGDSWAILDQDPDGQKFLSLLSSAGESPQKLVPEMDTPLGGLSAGLKDGGLILSGGSALHLLPPDEETATRISPVIEGSSLYALVDGEERALVRVYEDFIPRALLSVSLDGSDADVPEVLAEENDIRPLLLPAARTIVYQIDDVVHEVSWDGSSAPENYDSGRSVQPLGASPDERFLYACTYENVGQLLRLDRQTDAPKWEPYDGPTDDLLARDPTITVFDDRYFRCAGRILPIPGGTGQRDLLGAGSLQVPVATPVTDALFLRTPDGTRRRLSQESPGKIENAYLPPGSDRVFYGYLSARLSGEDKDERASFGTSELTFVTAVDETPLYYRPGAEAGSGELLVPRDDPGETGTRVLTDPFSPGATLQSWGRNLLVVRDGGVWLTPIDGQEPTLLLNREPSPLVGDRLSDWPAYLIDEQRNQALVASEGQLVAFSLDGSEAHSPRVLLEELPANYYHLRALYGPHALFFTYETRASGSYEDEAFTVALDGSDRAGARSIDSESIFAPRTVRSFPLGPFVSQDGRWALAPDGDLLKLTPVPPHEGQALMVEGPSPSYPIARAPGGDFVVLHADGALWRVPLSPEELEGTGARLLSPPLETTDIRKGPLWLSGDEFLLLDIQLDSRATVRLSTQGDGAESWDIMAGGEPNRESELIALSPDESWFVFAQGTPSQLMGAKFGESPFALTDDTDTFERFIGFAR
jgi:hypothetical protein